MKTARVYDFHTEKVSVIPLAELAQNMTEADVVGVGRVWIQTKQFVEQVVEHGPIIHSPLSDKLRERIKTEIMEPLLEVYPKTLDEWDDGFRRDQNAEREIAVWLVLARRYKEFSKENSLNKPQKKEAFKVMLHCTMVPNREAFWETFRPQFLKRKQVEAAIAPFEKNWRS
jgi:hypothetical protein